MTLRSLIFNLCFILWALLASVIFSPLFLISPRTAQRSGKPWALGSMWLARMILGLSYEVRGQDHIQDGPLIYASKHQSAWDTIIFLILFERPAYVLKRELLRIPGWGWYLWRMKMIAIDRAAGPSSIKQMIKESREALADSRPIIIYPEGTRTRPGANADYHPGTTALYSMLKVPVIPVALNSGHYWGKDAFMKKPGKVIIEFLPAIKPGLPKDAFAATLKEIIEARSASLLAEANQ
ncbi:MAG: 1-acyl-sn-glycerol-3-phosphate acyltransferase [Rickettsiales bacterium]|jgi:1-acyl-sn-glycerol-3-phosphate acyltransferase|nr:1-acyl-sn-glycerol-3-phosphate acyltransferase [Rickettsiales bacterium]